MNPNFRRDILQEFLKRLEPDVIPIALTKRLEGILDTEETVSSTGVIKLIEDCVPKVDNNQID